MLQQELIPEESPVWERVTNRLMEMGLTPGDVLEAARYYVAKKDEPVATPPDPRQISFIDLIGS